jgi:hypothetical protein
MNAMVWKVGGTTSIGGFDVGFETGSSPTSPTGSTGSTTGLPVVRGCPDQPTATAAFLLSVISPADFQALFAVANDDSTRAALNTGDANRLAWHVAGGDDCRTTSEAGRKFVSKFWELVQKYGQDQEVVPVPTQTGNGNDKSDVDVIVEGVKDFFTGILGGAVEGAKGAATAGGTASQTQAGFASVAFLLPLVIVAAVVFFIARR